jgi:hypothetical protein
LLLVLRLLSGRGCEMADSSLQTLPDFVGVASTRLDAGITFTGEALGVLLGEVVVRR